MEFCTHYTLYYALHCLVFSEVLEIGFCRDREFRALYCIAPCRTFISKTLFCGAFDSINTSYIKFG